MEENKPANSPQIKENFLIKIWVRKDADTSGDMSLYTDDTYSDKLQIIKESFKGITGEITNNKRTPDSLNHYAFRVAFYYTDNIKASALNKITYFQDYLGDKDGAEFSPIIHIIEEDGDIFLFDDYTKKYAEAPRYRFIVDSGIWNYFASDRIAFQSIVREVFLNWKAGYYNLYVGKEYADLNSRLTKESRLYKIPGAYSEGHGDAVSPFLFHSESILKKKLDTQEVSKYKWRFLLLDDKIDPEKTEKRKVGDKDVDVRIGLLSSDSNDIVLTKADVLRTRLEKMGMGDCCDIILAKDNYSLLPKESSRAIQIVCVETVDQAKEWLKRFEFDIILLDYLLQGSYGYELLNWIKNKYNAKEYTYCGDRVDLSEDKIIIGPQKKLFFMFISAFTTAVNERLTLEGLSRDEDFWLIGEGACPTNTPELFKYRLLHLMERRLMQTGINDLSDDIILDTVKQVFPSISSSSTSTPGERIQSVREQAYKTYNKILGFHYDYFLMRQNDKGARLVDSFMKDKVHLGAMLEHLLQLIHLTAFGTVRQWPEIWEEYQYFVRAVNISGGDKKNQKTLSEISTAIEKHIIDLKSEK